jgi:hypothetical protein
MRIQSLVVAAVCLVGAACASTPEDPNAPQACVTVDNSRGGSALARVFLVGTDGTRTRIGEVPMGRTVTECIRRSSFSGRYQLVVEEGAADRMDPALNQNQPRALVSESFVLEGGVRLTWDIRTNRIILNSSGG